MDYSKDQKIRPYANGLACFLRLVKGIFKVSDIGLHVLISGRHSYCLKQGRLSPAVIAYLQTLELPGAKNEQVSLKNLRIVKIRYQGNQFSLIQHQFIEPSHDLAFTLYALLATSQTISSDQWQILRDLENLLLLYLDSGYRHRHNRKPDLDFLNNDLPASLPSSRTAGSIQAGDLTSNQLVKFAIALQACLSYSDLRDLIKVFLPQLLPKSAGRFFIIDSPNQEVSRLANWGDTQYLPNLSSNCHLPYINEQRPLASSCTQCLSCPASRANQQFDCVVILDPADQQKPLGVLQLFLPELQLLSPQHRQMVRAIADQLVVVSKRLHLLHDLQNQVVRDGLTGLLNRRYLEEVLTKLIERTQHRSYQVALILLDIDHFKAINDSYGHLAGDEVLRNISMVLRGHVRPHDLACRYGGEEFCLVLPHTSLAVAMERADKIRRAIKYLRLSYEGEAIRPITLSLGVACAPEHGVQVETLIQQADKALYRAKRQGRDQVISADENPPPPLVIGGTAGSNLIR